MATGCHCSPHGKSGALEALIIESLLIQKGFFSPSLGQVLCHTLRSEDCDK